MAETRAQILARHNHEKQVAAEQYELRIRTMRERHLSELALATDQAGRTDTPNAPQIKFNGSLKALWIDIQRREDAWFLNEITARFHGVPLESLTDRITLNIYPDRKALVVDGKEVATLIHHFTDCALSAQEAHSKDIG